MWEWLVLFCMAALGWFAYDSMRSRERALAAGMRACKREGLQFLDGAAVCIALRPARNAAGHVVLRRTYRFEFSDDRYNRRGGTVTLLGGTIEQLNLEPLLQH